MASSGEVEIDENFCAMAAVRIQSLNLSARRIVQDQEVGEKARREYPDRVRRKIGIGVVRVPKQ